MADALTTLEFVGGGSLDGDYKQLPAYIMELRHPLPVSRPGMFLPESAGPAVSESPAFELELYRREGMTMKLYDRVPG